MNQVTLNFIFAAVVIVLIVLLIWEGVTCSHYEYKTRELLERLKIQDVTFDRLFKRHEKKIKQCKEAVDIADHAVAVIAEAREITMGTIREERINELARAFIDRRQMAANDVELKREIDKLTGGAA